jgi:hypothetical protein
MQRSSAGALITRGGMIGYICTRKRHLSSVQRSTLTIHNGEWAFCHDARPVGAHRWTATGGVPLADVQRSSMARELATD